MPKIRYSADFRATAVARVLSRSCSIAQVAREVGCTVGTLHTWLKKYRQQNSPPTEPASFVPVKIIDHQHHSAEIVLPNGITIRLDRLADLGSQAELHDLLPDKWKPKT